MSVAVKSVFTILEKFTVESCSEKPVVYIMMPSLRKGKEADLYSAYCQYLDH